MTQIRDRDRGGVKTYRTLEGGGELAPDSCPSKAWTFDPKLAIFYRISVEGGQFQGPLEIQNFHPPPKHSRSPIRVSQAYTRFLQNWGLYETQKIFARDCMSLKENAPLSLLNNPFIGRAPKRAYSARGRSRHLLETPFSEPLLRTLLRTLFYCKTQKKAPFSEPFREPFPRTLSRTFSEPRMTP